MRRALLLFDIDGTLLKTNGAGLRAMYRAAERLFGDWTWEGIQTAGHLDPLIFAEAAAANALQNHHEHHDRFRDEYVRELAAELAAARDQCVAMPGMHDALVYLRRRAVERGDVVNGLLTGNYTMAVPLKLMAVDIDPAWFTITAFGDEAASRPDLVALAMRKYEAHYGQPIDPRQVVVIGDTPRDVQCAHAHGCLAFTVTTGGASVDDLRAAGADFVVDDLSDPTPLIDLIDRTVSARAGT